jgi:hypothetical protein
MIFRETENEKEGRKLGANFSPVSIHITLQNFSDLRKMYRAVRQINVANLSEMGRGFSGWSTWDELGAFIKSKIDEDLLK